MKTSHACAVMADTTSAADRASQMTMMIMTISYHDKHRNCKPELQAERREDLRENQQQAHACKRDSSYKRQFNDDLQTETQTRCQSSVPLSAFPQTIFMIPANDIRKHGR